MCLSVCMKKTWFGHLVQLSILPQIILRIKWDVMHSNTIQVPVCIVPMILIYSAYLGILIWRSSFTFGSMVFFFLLKKLKIVLLILKIIVSTKKKDLYYLYFKKIIISPIIKEKIVRLSSRESFSLCVNTSFKWQNEKKRSGI